LIEKTATKNNESLFNNSDVVGTESRAAEDGEKICWRNSYGWNFVVVLIKENDILREADGEVRPIWKEGGEDEKNGLRRRTVECS